MNHAAGQRSRTEYLNIHVCHAFWATGRSVINRGDRFIRHSLIWVREISDLVPSVGDLSLAAKQVLGIMSRKEFLQPTG